MHNKEEIVRAFLWMSSNSEKLRTRINYGDPAAKALEDSYTLACSNPESSLAWSLLAISFSTLENCFCGDWNTPDITRENEFRKYLELWK